MSPEHEDAEPRRSGGATWSPLWAGLPLVEDGPNPIDIFSTHEQTVTLNDSENRIDSRGITGYEFDTNAGGSARLGDDLGLESILSDRHIDQIGRHGEDDIDRKLARIQEQASPQSLGPACGNVTGELEVRSGVPRVQ
jgi:hypothetical protein